MGDKGGKKDMDKSKKQKTTKHEQKAKGEQREEPPEELIETVPQAKIHALPLWIKARPTSSSRRHLGLRTAVTCLRALVNAGKSRATTRQV